MVKFAFDQIWVWFNMNLFDNLSKEYLKGKYHCTVDLLFDWFGISCMTTNNFCFYSQNRLIQTCQTGGQRYNETSPFSIPWFKFAQMWLCQIHNFRIFFSLGLPNWHTGRKKPILCQYLKIHDWSLPLEFCPTRNATWVGSSLVTKDILYRPNLKLASLSLSRCSQNQDLANVKKLFLSKMFRQNKLERLPLLSTFNLV